MKLDSSAGDSLPTGQSNVDALLQRLAQAPVAPMSLAEARPLEQRIARRIEQLAAELRRSQASVWRTRQPWLWASAAAAIAAASVIGILRLGPHSSAHPAAARITRVRGTVEVLGDPRVPPGSASGQMEIHKPVEVRTAEDALAEALWTTGAKVEVGPSSRVRFLPEETGGHERDAIALEQGRIDVEVPRLPTSIGFAVRTSDAVIIGRDARASVERRVGGTDPDETRVSVAQGEVVIRCRGTEQVLVAGQTWSSPPLTTTALPRTSTNESVPPSGPEADRIPTPAPSISGEVVGDRGGRAAAAPRSTLAEENELLQAAMTARQQGKPARAVRDLDRFLKRYAGSPLTEAVRVERLRALSASGQYKRMETEARRYLLDYPHGFAREEAMTLLANVPGGR